MHTVLSAGTSYLYIMDEPGKVLKKLLFNSTDRLVFSSFFQSTHHDFRAGGEPDLPQ